MVLYAPTTVSTERSQRVSKRAAFYEAYDLGGEAVQRQAHHIVVTPVDAFDKRAAYALYAVCACFTERLASCDVGADELGRQGRKLHLRRLREAHCARRNTQRRVCCGWRGLVSQRMLGASWRAQRARTDGVRQHQRHAGVNRVSAAAEARQHGLRPRSAVRLLKHHAVDVHHRIRRDDQVC